MSWLRIRNWDVWQTYRRDRALPPWIKVHRALMRDANWVELTDAERGQLVAIWMLAADKDGVIPASPALIRKLCFMEQEPNVQGFQDKGFIEKEVLDVMPTPRRRQPDAEVTPQRRVEERRGEERETADAVAPAEDAYAFKGSFVKGINEADLQCWLESFPTFTRSSMLAELKRCDEYFSGRGYSGTKPKNWFITASNWVQRTHRRVQEENKPARRHSPEMERMLKGAL